MRWFTKLRLRYRSLFDRSRVEDDLEDELRDYINGEIERQVGAGATPEEARKRALSSLGGMNVSRRSAATHGVSGGWKILSTMCDLHFVHSAKPRYLQ